MNHLHQIFRTPVEQWKAAAEEWGKPKGIRIFVYETFRTAERQAQLYSWGRTCKNPNSVGPGFGPCVTYTLDSSHEYGVAADWVALVLRNGTWVQDWSHATYDAIYKAVPPAKYGLETFSWEKPHIQLKGVNGINQKTSGSVWAAAHGIKVNVIVGSRWPLPVAPNVGPAIVKPAPVKVVVKAQYVRPPRVFMRDPYGGNKLVTSPDDYGLYSGEVVGQLPDGRLTIGGVIVGVYSDCAIQLDRLK